jgi:hypothetical protein
MDNFPGDMLDIGMQPVLDIQDTCASRHMLDETCTNASNSAEIERVANIIRT